MHMGREERENRAGRQAELERTMGPTREFGVTAECDKCGLPIDHPQFAKIFCIGKSILRPSDEGCQQFGEHLHVICPRCKYGWLEHCKDHVDEGDEINFSREIDAAVRTTVTPRIISDEVNP
jgi:hypothetical protein